MSKPPLSVYTLYSGSQGNSVYIRSEDTELLIDAGMSARVTEQAVRNVGSDISHISAVLVTHEHSDHIGGLEVLSKHHRIPVHITEPSASKLSRSGHLYKNSVLHPPLYTLTLGNIEIASFVTPHDSEMCVGYIIKTACGTIGVATDIGYIPDSVAERLAACDYIVLESNHDEGMLLDGPYPYMLKQRILSKYGHLSNSECAKCIRALSDCGVKRVLLAHLSSQNNSPDLAYRETERALGDRLGKSVALGVAARTAPTRLV